MRSTRPTVVAALALCAACSKGDHGVLPVTAHAPAPVPQQLVAPSPITHGSRITAATGTKVLTGSLNPQASPRFDTGRMDPTTTLTYEFMFSPAGTKAERDAVVTALQTPGSLMYHQWLTPEDYAARFGASQDDIARVSAWLQEQGFTVEGSWRGNTNLFFTGTIGQLESAFQTEMHTYEINGAKHFALGVEPSIPAAFGDLVMGLHGVHDFRTPAPKHTNVPLAGRSPDYRSGANELELAPPDFAAIYDVLPLYSAGIDGTGQTLAVAGEAELTANDYATFRSTFNLPTNTVNAVLVPGTGASAQNSTDAQQEAMLDVEWTGAVAKSANVTYVYVGNSPNYDVITALQYGITQDLAPILSLSFGGCEGYYDAVYNAYNETLGVAATMFGITLVIASGDQGSASCDGGNKTAEYGEWVAYPASLPEAVAVGGTDVIPTPADEYFNDAGTAISYIPEQVWNETSVSEKNGGAIAAGGGGRSSIFTKPYWQFSLTPSDGQRDVPDVSLSSGAYIMPHVVVYNGSLAAIGGTSASAPSFAGVLTLLNQELDEAKPGLGNANPVLYALAAQVPSAFHDITTGSNCVPCATGSPDCPSSACGAGQMGFPATAGYDLATGIGSVDVNNLVTAWKALSPTGTSLMASASGMTEGSPLTLTITISSMNTSATQMTGAVDFYYSTNLPDDGGLDLAQLLPGGEQSISPTMVGGDEGATVTFQTTAPPGFTGTSTVVAFYGGDQNYLASWSSPVTVTATSTLTIMPTAVTVVPLQTVQFTSNVTGSNSVIWQISGGSSLNATIEPTTGLYTAGDAGGTDNLITALDSYGAQVVATVTITSPTEDGGPPNADGGSTKDASSGDSSSGADSAAPGTDASSGDAATEGGEGDGGSSGGSSKSGCACSQAGAGGATSALGASLALLGVFGLRARRRRR